MYVLKKVHTRAVAYYVGVTAYIYIYAYISRIPG